ncbi:MAG TPA: MarR family transcriptional regulator [Thermomicrobiales bacterium]|nr:MarR family transcriptional regulator [Thermomicrobiales bacterium]
MNLAELHYIGKTLMECAVHGMQALGGKELSSTELMVAESLLVLGPASIGEISRRTGFAQSRISTVVAEMSDRDIVRVRSDERDRRRTIVEISEGARDAVARVSREDAAPALADWFPHATHEQLADLILSLQAAFTAPATEPGARSFAGDTGLTMSPS